MDSVIAEDRVAIHSPLFLKGRDKAYNFLKSLADYNESFAMDTLRSFLTNESASAELKAFVAHIFRIFDNNELGQ